MLVISILTVFTYIQDHKCSLTRLSHEMWKFRKFLQAMNVHKITLTFYLPEECPNIYFVIYCCQIVFLMIAKKTNSQRLSVVSQTACDVSALESVSMQMHVWFVFCACDSDVVTRV